MGDMQGIGLIGELEALQRAENEWWAGASPAERTARAKATLRLIAETEDDAPGWYADV